MRALVSAMASAIQFLTDCAPAANRSSRAARASRGLVSSGGRGARRDGRGRVHRRGRKCLPPSLAALATVAFWAAASGVLHEDGLADVADALRAGRTPERMLAILKDSRIGTFGAVAMVLSILARWQALEHINAPSILCVCIAAQAVPRAAMVGLAWTSRPVGTGLGYELASTLTTPAALAALAQGSPRPCCVESGWASRSFWDAT